MFPCKNAFFSIFSSLNVSVEWCWFSLFSTLILQEHLNILVSKTKPRQTSWTGTSHTVGSETWGVSHGWSGDTDQFGLLGGMCWRSVKSSGSYVPFLSCKPRDVWPPWVFPLDAPFLWMFLTVSVPQTSLRLVQNLGEMVEGGHSGDDTRWWILNQL